ncbi:hypothetical protein D3C73_1496150 [compost metagenome]
MVIQGHVENDSWIGKDGVEHYDLRLIVDDIRLKNRRESAPDGDQTAGGAIQETAGATDLNDDIPF